MKWGGGQICLFSSSRRWWPPRRPATQENTQKTNTNKAAGFLSPLGPSFFFFVCSPLLLLAGKVSTMTCKHNKSTQQNKQTQKSILFSPVCSRFLLLPREAARLAAALPRRGGEREAAVAGAGRDEGFVGLLSVDRGRLRDEEGRSWAAAAVRVRLVC